MESTARTIGIAPAAAIAAIHAQARRRPGPADGGG